MKGSGAVPVLKGTKLGGSNKKGPGVNLKGDMKSGAWGKKGTKAPKKSV